MASLRDLPQELVDMVVAQVPPDAYVLHFSWEPPMDTNNYTGKQQDVLGVVFATTQHANETGRDIMHQKVKEVECTEKMWIKKLKKPVSDSDDSFEFDEWENPDGTLSWGLVGRYSEQMFYLDVKKCTFSKVACNKDEIPSASHDEMKHSKVCRCRDQNHEESSAKETDDYDDEGEDMDEREEETESEEEEMDGTRSEDDRADGAEMDE